MVKDGPESYFTHLCCFHLDWLCVFLSSRSFLREDGKFRGFLTCVKKSLTQRQIVLYRFPMAAAHPGTPPLQLAPPVPPPPGRFRSDEPALCQSNRCAAPCAECPSGTCLEQKRVSGQRRNTNVKPESQNTYKWSLLRPCPDLRAAPTGVARPARIGQSTCKLPNKVNVTVGSDRRTIQDSHTSQRSSYRAQQAYKTHPGT